VVANLTAAGIQLAVIIYIFVWLLLFDYLEIL
jgi:hypothetical protein